MNRRFVLTVLFAMLLGLPVLVADDKNEDQPPADLPDTTESAKLAERMPAEVSGRVLLDREPLAGVRVTDGIDFVTTDDQGRYTLAIKPDPMVPYVPSRTVSVCWPSGTWPVQRGKGGPWQWWVRLADVKNPEQVDFHLTPREEKLPVCMAFGTDPHDAFRRPHNYTFRDEVARAGDHVAFAVAGGDLGYMGFGNAETEYRAIAKFTNEFPVTMFHCIGNHDIVGVHSRWWNVPHELAGNGAYIKYLGPLRWSFDYAGVHFVGLDYSVIDDKGHLQCGISDTAIDWLEKDLQSLPEGTPTYLFSHQWGEKRFSDVCSKYNVKLCLAGHSHRNMYMGNHGGAEYWTKMSLYTLLYVDRQGHQFVDRCVYKGGRNGWDGNWRHNHRGCALYTDAGREQEQRGKHVALENVTLNDKSQAIGPVDGPTYDLRVGARVSGGKSAKRWGVQITARNGTVCELAYDEAAQMLQLMGHPTYFNRQIPGAETADDPEQEWLEMRIFVMPYRVRVIVNNRLHYQEFIELGPAKKIEVFGEDGQVEFGRIDLWQRTWPKDWEPRATINTG